MKWCKSWGYRDTDFNMFPIVAEDETQRLYFFNNLYSEKLRLRFSNRWGRYPLPIEQVFVAECDENGCLTGESCPVTFNGNCFVTIPERTLLYSDEIAFEAKPGSWISVSLYIREKTKITCAITTKTQLCTRLSASKGNHCTDLKVEGERFIDPNQEFLKYRPTYMMVGVGLCQVEMYSDDEVKQVTFFGSSNIQQGHWTEAITKKIYSMVPGKICFVNQAMGGNRMLHDASSRNVMGRYFGDRGVDRFEEDCFGSPSDSPSDLIILGEGLNDIIQPVDGNAPMYEVVLCEELVESYRTVIDTAHRYNAKIIGVTTNPCKGFNQVWTPENANLWWAIYYAFRDNTIGFDAVFDSVRVLGDKDDLAKFAPEYDSGDHLHTNKEGGQAFMECIDLSVILKCLNIDIPKELLK